MADELIKSCPNVTALTGSPGALDLLLIEKYQSGGDPAVPANNTYASSNMFVRDWLASLGLSGNNKIINGDMRVSQRVGSALISFGTAGTFYTMDRWAAYTSQVSKFSIQQNAGAVALPAGASNYLGVTSLSSYTVGSGDLFGLQYGVEGLDSADLQWGTANAKAATLSFLVYSSLTGTFGGSLRNSGSTRSYPFNYSIANANTWTQIDITVPGDTAGTWLTNTGLGISISLGLGVGTTNSGAAGSWAAAGYLSATGAVSVVGTSGATFYLTNVKLEAGSVPTPFIPDTYQVSLQKCQRYCQIIGDPTSANGTFGTGHAIGGNSGEVGIAFYPMRVAPTAIFLGLVGNYSMYNADHSANYPCDTVALPTPTINSGRCEVHTSSGGASGISAGQAFDFLGSTGCGIQLSADF